MPDNTITVLLTAIVISLFVIVVTPGVADDKSDIINLPVVASIVGTGLVFAILISVIMFPADESYKRDVSDKIANQIEDEYGFSDVSVKLNDCRTRESCKVDSVEYKKGDELFKAEIKYVRENGFRLTSESKVNQVLPIKKPETVEKNGEE